MLVRAAPPAHIFNALFFTDLFGAPRVAGMCCDPRYTSFPERGGCKKVAGRTHIAVYIMHSLVAVWLKHRVLEWFKHCIVAVTPWLVPCIAPAASCAVFYPGRPSQAVCARHRTSQSEVSVALGCRLGLRQTFADRSSIIPCKLAFIIILVIIIFIAYPLILVCL